MEKYSVLMIGVWGILFILKNPDHPKNYIAWIWFGSFALIAILMFVRETISKRSKKVT